MGDGELEAGEFGHEPVLVEEVVDLVGAERGGLFLDGTVGGGGHADAILGAVASARVVGLDRDPDAVEAAKERLKAYGDRVTVLRGDFRDAPEHLRDANEDEELAGALLDLGVSSHQIETTARGFSFRPGTPLNMRMGGTTGGWRPAADLLNEAPERELGRIFREYGEERRWRRLAREVVERRSDEPFRTSDDLVEAMRRALGRSPSPRDKARVFQAVRIAVNRELDALEEALPAIRDLLASGGRFVVIAYHSLEDRIVKNAFRDWSRECICPPEIPVCRCRGVPLGERVVKGPVTPSQAEIERNPRARSAKLRAWRRA